MACDASNGASLNAAKTECECLTNGADDLTKVLVGTKGSEIYEFSARADFVLAEAQFGASFPDIPCDDIPCVHPPQVDKGRDSSLPNIFGFRHSRPSAGI